MTRPGSIQEERCTAIVVNYQRSRSDALALLERLGGGKAFPLVLVDNSGDFPDMERVKILRPGRNLGFAAGVNHGAREVRTKWIALANPDTNLNADHLRALLQVAQARPDLGILGPRLTYPDGRPQINGGRFSGAMAEVSRTLGIGPLLRGLRGRLRSEEITEAGQIVDREWVSGAAMVITVDAWLAVGGFDERFFMYFDDEDLCRRLSKRGWRVGLCPQVTVAHEVGGASGLNPYRGLAFQQSRVAYHDRHSPYWLRAFVRWSARRITRGGVAA